MKFFPDFEIVEYKQNPLFETVFQARYPDIAGISFEQPVSFQNELRELGYYTFSKEVPQDNSNDNIEANPRSYFRSDERGLQVVLSIDSIAVVYFKNRPNVECFREDIIEVLERFIKCYEFGKFTGIELIHRNMINKTFITNLDVDINNFIPEHVFPELKLDNSGEIDSIRKVSTFKDGEITTRVMHILANITGEYGWLNVYSEKSFIVDMHCFHQIDIGGLEDVSGYYKNIQKICWNAFHYSITEELRRKLI